TFQLATELISALVSPTNNEPLIRARTYFSKIRRLAHIYLDLTNLPTYVQFHPALLLQRISSNPSDFLESDTNSAIRLISSLLDYLQEEIYSSQIANRYKLGRVLIKSRMSDLGAEAELFRSFRALPVLTQSGQ